MIQPAPPISAVALPIRQEPQNQPPTSSANNMLKKIGCFSAVLGSAAGVSFLVGRAIGRLRMGAPIPFASRVLNIQACSSDDALLLQHSHGRISRNIQNILNGSLTELSADNEHKLEVCFESESQSCATYVCSNSSECIPTSSGLTLGYFTHPATHNNAIYLCMDNLKSLTNDNDTLNCYFDDTIVHEVAHYIDVKAAPDHNNGPNNDAVYKVGNAAGYFCLEDLKNNSTRML